MSLRNIPRPRSVDQLAELIIALAARLDTVANGQLSVSQQIGALTAELAEMRTFIRPGPYREREASIHDFDPLVAEFRNALKEGVKDAARPQFDSTRARAIANEAVHMARQGDKARAYDTLRSTVVRVAMGVIVGVLVAMVLAHFGLHP